MSNGLKLSLLIQGNSCVTSDPGDKARQPSQANDLWVVGTESLKS